MSDDDFELVRGSGNVFADFGDPNAEAEQLKATLAAQIIRVLDARGLTVRAAQELTGTAAADFSRIRRAKLDRFTIDRLMRILGQLGIRPTAAVTFEFSPEALAIQTWNDLARRLRDRAAETLDRADLANEDQPDVNVSVVSLSLLARTIEHLDVTLAILRSRYVVEARVLVRCCLENLFWISSLAANPKEFLESVELDDATSRMKRAADWISWSNREGNRAEFADRLESFHENLKKQYGKGASIRQQKSAEDGGVADAYLIYRELSADSAHPSATSLSRHLRAARPAANLELVGAPIASDEEIEDTLELLCMAVLGVVVGANQIAGGVAATETLEELANVYGELSNGKAKRKAVA